MAAVLHNILYNLICLEWTKEDMMMQQKLLESI
jgi:hypothetical protein